MIHRTSSGRAYLQPRRSNPHHPGMRLSEYFVNLSLSVLSLTLFLCECATNPHWPCWYTPKIPCFVTSSFLASLLSLPTFCTAGRAADSDASGYHRERVTSQSPSCQSPAKCQCPSTQAAHIPRTILVAYGTRHHHTLLVVTTHLSMITHTRAARLTTVSANLHGPAMSQACLSMAATGCLMHHGLRSRQAHPQATCHNGARVHKAQPFSTTVALPAPKVHTGPAHICLVTSTTFLWPALLRSETGWSSVTS